MMPPVDAHYISYIEHLPQHLPNASLISPSLGIAIRSLCNPVSPPAPNWRIRVADKHASRYLRAASVVAMAEAADLAFREWHPFNRWISINLEVARVRVKPNRFITSFLAHAGDWLGTKGVDRHYIWEHWQVNLNLPQEGPYPDFRPRSLQPSRQRSRRCETGGGSFGRSSAAGD